MRYAPGNLAAAGVRPGEVDYVFCTHLHSDHCGWNTRLVGGRWEPTFANAKYVLAREECQAMEAENSLIFIENVQPILEAGQAVLLTWTMRWMTRSGSSPRWDTRWGTSRSI